MCCGASELGLSFIHNRHVFQELERMADDDTRLRTELLATGELFEGYHPRMEATHRRNAARLKEIIAEHGWPGKSLVGEEGATYAWLILQHSIGDPELQRHGLELLRDAVARGEAPATHAAYLEDRIRMYEGRPQLYGTQFDWDSNGRLSPVPIEDPEHVNERRRSIGLDTIEHRTQRMREDAGMENAMPPRDYGMRQREYEEWLQRVGWRKTPPEFHETTASNR
jgi:hypothetical protein